MSIQNDLEDLKHAITDMQQHYQFQLKQLRYHLNVYEKRYDDVQKHVLEIKKLGKFILESLEKIEYSLQKLDSHIKHNKIIE